MKKFASSVLYVLSIIVAVGIGMFFPEITMQMNAHDGARNDDCHFMWRIATVCPSTTEGECGQGNYYTGSGSGDRVQEMYYPTCVKRYGDKPGEYNPDPNCYAISKFATTNGCDE